MKNEQKKHKNEKLKLEALESRRSEMEARGRTKCAGLPGFYSPPAAVKIVILR